MNVQFIAEDVTVQNAVRMEEQTKRELNGPVPGTTALSIATPARSAIVSLTTSRTTPTSTTTASAVKSHDKLLLSLIAMEQQNARLPQELSKVFGNAVKPWLEVHRDGAQKALEPRFGVAKTRPVPLATQASPAGMRKDSSGGADLGGQASIAEENEPRRTGKG